MRGLILSLTLLCLAAPTQASSEKPSLRWASLPMTRSDLRTPPRYKWARREWKRAVRSFKRRRYRTAARQFETIGHKLKSRGRGAQAKTLQTARCVSYENAAWSTYLGSGKRRARRHIRRMAKRDRSCRHDLERLSGRLR